MKFSDLCVLLIAFLGSAYAATPEADFATLSAQPTPSSWHAGSVWAFPLPESAGSQAVLTYRVTNRPAQTCPPGDWLELEPVDAAPKSMAGTPLKPAYRVFGRYLIVHPVSNVCDMDDEIRGMLDGDRFEGEYISGGMLGSAKLGPVHGRRVP